MTLPVSGYISSPGRTSGEQKTALEDLRDHVAQLPGGSAEATLTIASGNVTPGGEDSGRAKSTYAIDTEGAAGTDDLTNIIQTNIEDGAIVLIHNVSTARIVVCKHVAGGTGQLSFTGGVDVSLRDPKQWLILKRTGSLWEELVRSPSLMYGTTEESGFVVESAKGTADRVQRTRYLPVGHGRLSYVSATQIAFQPFKGTLLPVKDANGWRMRDIGSSGVVSSNPTTATNFVNGTGSQILGASTTYDVYVFDNAGTLTFDFRTPGHSRDTSTGVEIKTAVDTRTLVGMVRTNATPNFVDDNTLRGVISYYNRRKIGLITNFTASRTTTSTTYVELNTEIRGNFLTWSDEAVTVSVIGLTSNDTASHLASTAVGFDGTNQENAMTSAHSPVGGQVFPIGISFTKNGLAEGFHYATVLGCISSTGTGTWYGGTFASDTTRRAITSLSVGILG
jgi:hypothetical protein